jgi:hypothetical protein
MSPETFHDLLERETRHEPPLTVADPTSEGRRLLRRRRLSQLGAGAAVLVLAGAAYGLADPGLDRATDHPTGPASAPTQAAPVSDAALLDSCRDGVQSEAATERIFSSGTPTIESSMRTDHQVVLAVQSADGRAWANCFVHLDAQEFDSGMTVYDASGTSTSLSYSLGGGCGLVDGDVDGGCRVWAATYVDRLPEPVAAVRFDLGDGSTTTVDTQDGFVALNVLRPLPAGTTLDPMGDLPDQAAISRVTYLDASRAPLASQAMDGSGTGPDHEVVDGLPLLRAYPSLRSDQSVD